MDRIHPFFVILLISLFSICYCFPNLDWRPLLKSAYALFDRQIQHPFVQIYPMLRPGINLDTHFFNTAYRIFIPVSAHILHIKCHEVVYLQIILMPVFLYVLFLVLKKYGIDKPTSLILTFGFSLTYFTHAFVQLYPYFDSIAFLLLLIALLAENHYMRFCLLLCACLVDERALMELISIYLLSVTYRYENMELKLLLRKDKLKYLFIAVIVAYAGIRLWLRFGFDLHILWYRPAWQDPVEVVHALPQLLLACLITFKGFSIILVVAMVYYIRKKFISGLILGSLVFILLSYYLPTTADYTRGIAYHFFFILFVIFRFYKDVDATSRFRQLSALTAIACLFIPSYYIFNFQQLSMYIMHSFIYFYKSHMIL
jgi:hypothetical protein